MRVPKLFYQQEEYMCLNLDRLKELTSLLYKDQTAHFLEWCLPEAWKGLKVKSMAK